MTASKNVRPLWYSLDPKERCGARITLLVPCPTKPDSLAHRCTVRHDAHRKTAHRCTCGMRWWT